MTTRVEQGSKLVLHHAADEQVLDNGLPHIWLCDLDDNTQNGMSHCLSASERLRVMRLKDPLDRRRMARRFAYARRVIENVAGISLDGWEFSYDLQGKPAPLSLVDSKGGLTTLYFNVSHSENVLALAVLFGQDVGVDIEVVRPDVDFLAVARMQLDPESFGMLSQAPPSGIAGLFYRMWTRKEAIAKLDGSGIAHPPKKTRAGLPVLRYGFDCKIGRKEIVGACACYSQHRELF